MDRGSVREVKFYSGMSKTDMYCFPDAQRELQSMLTTICTHNQVSNPMLLWTTHSESHDQRLRENYNEALKSALHEVNSIMEESGTSCISLGLPQPKKGEYLLLILGVVEDYRLLIFATDKILLQLHWYLVVTAKPTSF